MPVRISRCSLRLVSFFLTTFIAVPGAFSGASVKSHQKISETSGNLNVFFFDDDRFGISIAPLGDLDADGVDDIVVGAYLDHFDVDQRGAIYVCFLNADGTVKSRVKIGRNLGGFTGTLDFWDEFGVSLAPLGDLDGDGIMDLAVGARLDDDGGEDFGAVWILFLNSNGTVKSHQKISQTAGGFGGDLDSADLFGAFVDPIGDFDGDGVVDLAISALQDDDGGLNCGAVWLVYLNSNGTVKTQSKISRTAGGFTGTLDPEDRFGTGLRRIGDLDGDGVSDLAIGANRDDDGGIDRGALWIVFLNANGTVKAHQKISSTAGGFGGPLDNEDIFGQSVAVMSPLDAPGPKVLAVTSARDDDGGLDRGAIWILRLNTNGTVKSQSKISSTDPNFSGQLNNEDEFGLGAASLGDFDGDGSSDLAIGARLADDGGWNHGAIWLLFLDECTVSPEVVDFGTVSVGTSVDQVLFIHNDGGATMNGHVSESCDAYEIVSGGGPFTLNGDQTLEVTVRFSPPTVGQFECTVLTGIGSCTDFTLTGLGDAPVPVAFTRFDAIPVGQRVELRWDVAFDEAFSGFYVYRADGAGDLERYEDAALPASTTSFSDEDVKPGQSYRYMVSAIDIDGNETFSPIVTAEVAALSLALDQNHPNPFNPQTTISYTLPHDMPVTLAIYDVEGRLVKALSTATGNAGRNRVTWDGTNARGETVSSGIYLYRLRADKSTLTRKMVLLK